MLWKNWDRHIFSYLPVGDLARNPPTPRHSLRLIGEDLHPQGVPVGDAFHVGGALAAIAGRGEVGDGEMVGEDEAGILPLLHGHAFAGQDVQVERMDQGTARAGLAHMLFDLPEQGCIFRMGRIPGQSDADDPVRIGALSSQQGLAPDQTVRDEVSTSPVPLHSGAVGAGVSPTGPGEALGFAGTSRLANIWPHTAPSAIPSVALG